MDVVVCDQCETEDERAWLEARDEQEGTRRRRRTAAGGAEGRQEEDKDDDEDGDDGDDGHHQDASASGASPGSAWVPNAAAPAFVPGQHSVPAPADGAKSGCRAERWRDALGLTEGFSEAFFEQAKAMKKTEDLQAVWRDIPVARSGERVVCVELYTDGSASLKQDAWPQEVERAGWGLVALAWVDSGAGHTQRKVLGYRLGRCYVGPGK